MEWIATMDEFPAGAHRRPSEPGLRELTVDETSLVNGGFLPVLVGVAVAAAIVTWAATAS